MTTEETKPTPGTEPIVITQLQAQNVKRLKAVTVTPHGNLVVVGGRNAQGKSSLLDSIAMALGGGREIPDKPVRNGSEKGVVVAELSNGLTVRRTFTSKGGGGLTITDSTGEPIGSPQTLLDKLTGSLTFDPLAFVSMDARKQLETLKGLVGLDFTELDVQRQTAYQQRHTTGLKLKEVEGRVKPLHTDTPDAEVNVVEAVNELNAIAEQMKAKDDAQTALNRAINDASSAEYAVKTAESTDGIDAAADAVGEAQEAVEKAQSRLKEAIALRCNNIDTAKAYVAECSDAAEKATMAYEKAVTPDHGRRADLNELIATSQVTNQRVRENIETKANQESAGVLKRSYDEFTNAMTVIDDTKAEQLRTAEFPVPGLAFNENGVLYGGVPFEQASSAEQLRVSVAMGLACNPGLKIILVRDGSLLDDDGLEIIAGMAADAGAQVWMERVGKGDECQVIIEDGMVEAQAATPQEVVE